MTYAAFELDALVECANDLEPPPATVTRLASVIADPDPDLHEIGEIGAFLETLQTEGAKWVGKCTPGNV